MSNVFPYSFNFKNLSDSEDRRVTYCVLVEQTRTRSKKTVIKAKHGWDEPWATVLDLSDLTETPAWEELTDQERKDSTMARCHFFWDCMRYSAVLGFLEINAVQDSVDWSKITIFLQRLKKPAYDKDLNIREVRSLIKGETNYIQELINAFPELDIQIVNNGF